MTLAVKHNKSLSVLASFGVGGVAEHFVRIRGEALPEALAWAEEQALPFRVIGSATNVVFPNYLPGLLIQLDGGEVRNGGQNELVADAGVPLQALVDAANARGLKGLETLAGIPGTVGGAVVGNAGAYGREIKDTLVSATVFTRYSVSSTKYQVLSKKECRFAYRESIFKHELLIITEARFRFFDEAAPAWLTAASDDIIKKRAEKYRPGLKCPGSFFKNIPAKDAPPAFLEKIDAAKIICGKIPTGYLLEVAGAKGLCAHDICVSDFHGNLILNKGRGTPEDVERLAEKLKTLVRERWGITLEEEVRYL